MTTKPTPLISSKHMCSHRCMRLTHPNGRFHSTWQSPPNKLRQLSRAVIKTALPDNRDAVACLKREQETYRLPSVQSSSYFRRLYEVIRNSDGDSESPPYLVLEWMDTTLRDLDYEPHTNGHNFFKTIMETVLSSIVILIKHNLVNAGN